ncbi:AbrB/MazE/SpoVT family DNA-binding domain-containing protein [Candidatus Magnetominusculus xianensis]|uniref:Transcriptional regulator, AbrB family n=1 Tax=Candidatus Magnetominusculus xianensis TaxID=1748249 RepID=A0ABR5SJE2_9BACT|nr:AbrB/MazE/SpoVT family DNA-binding domain-containing protein [Candidatus Magnetominusculus xianensis]KWT94602.1 transcriptional regulator, AbrB family [Candidatus Magnetominusculus xianensis]MBF0403314.1 AbrB/MazE/SpoVT family DNA-binding domain-containing protein [Nitrospirota bacterium]
MLRKVNRNFQITLPVKFRKRFDVHEGDLLEVVESEGGFIFRPVELKRKQVLKELYVIYEKLSDNPYADLPEDEVMEIVNRKIREVREERRKEAEEKIPSTS